MKPIAQSVHRYPKQALQNPVVLGWSALVFLATELLCFFDIAFSRNLVNVAKNQRTPGASCISYTAATCQDKVTNPIGFQIHFGENLRVTN